MINSSFRLGLQEMVNDDELNKVELIAEETKRYYSQNFGWKKLSEAPFLWAGILRQHGEAPPRPPGPELNSIQESEEHILPPSDQVSMAPLGQRLNLIDGNGVNVLGDRRNLKESSANAQLSRIAIVIDEKTVGWVSILQSRSLSGRLADNFYQQQSQHMLAIALLTIACSLVIAFFLVRHFLKPLRALHQGTQAIESGDFEYQIQEQGNDEFTELTQVFNRLVLSLKKQKQDRENWLSDISHELRTPLAVLKGEIEAIQDGIRPASPEYVDSLHRQVLNLENLVNDLHQLSLSDSGIKPQHFELDLALIVQQLTAQNQHRFSENKLRLSYEVEDQQTLYMLGDDKTIRQLITNLLENSYRYTDSGGEVHLQLSTEQNALKLCIDDSYPGVDEHALPRLFERLYRVDSSRNRASGGSGLGLSICQSIAEAHSGSIIAQQSPLGGLRVIVTLAKK
ncbi:ATP-binding protein [Alginatibacterium sediminis]|nr:ATP-binding protein [Alginatibacterium sediminis]